MKNKECIRKVGAERSSHRCDSVRICDRINLSVSGLCDCECRDKLVRSGTSVDVVSADALAGDDDETLLCCVSIDESDSLDIAVQLSIANFGDENTFFIIRIGFSTIAPKS